MHVAADRRQLDRRGEAKIPEPLERRGERRTEERRTSPRVPLRIKVRPRGGVAFDICEGNVSVMGAFLHGLPAVLGRDVELRIRLPGRPRSLRAMAQVLHVRTVNGGLGVHVAFTEVAPFDVLELAKHVERAESV